MMAVILWKLTGKWKVVGRYFGDTSLDWRANGDITNRQKDRAIMIHKYVIEIFSSNCLGRFSRQLLIIQLVVCRQKQGGKNYENVIGWSWSSR
jgi:uncharacterized membrane protein YbaN (DUF454 family)